MTNFSEKKVLCTLLLLLRESEYFFFLYHSPFTSSLKDSYIEMVDKKYELAQYTIATLIAVYFPCIVFSNSPFVPSSLRLRALLNIICKGIILVAAIAILVNRLRSYSIEQFLAFEVDTGNLNVYNYNCLKNLIL